MQSDARKVFLPSYWSVVSGQWSVVREQSPNLKVSLIVLRHIVVQAEQEGETKEKSKASKKEKIRRVFASLRFYLDRKCQTSWLSK